MNIDPVMLFAWAKVIVLVGLPLATALWAIWQKNENVQKKINESIPLVWNAVQQELRKNGGNLPNGKKPLDFGLELLGSMFKMSAQQQTAARVGLQAHHEMMGAPEPGAKR